MLTGRDLGTEVLKDRQEVVIRVHAQDPPQIIFVVDTGAGRASLTGSTDCRPFDPAGAEQPNRAALFDASARRGFGRRALNVACVTQQSALAMSEGGFYGCQLMASPFVRLY